MFFLPFNQTLVMLAYIKLNAFSFYHATTVRMRLRAPHEETTMKDQAMRCYAAECIGTFALVFIGTAVATLQGFLSGYGHTGWLGISFAFGSTLAILVWVIGPVSGCHINPAVTLPMAISGRCPWRLVPGYIGSQLLGAILASALLLLLLRGLPGYDLMEHGLAANGNPRNMSLISLFLWETILTALFLFTIFSATRKSVPAGFSALIIGGYLFVAHLVSAQLGDASLNPARSFGPAILQGGEALKVLWIFTLGPLLGGWIGWSLYQVIYDEA